MRRSLCASGLFAVLCCSFLHAQEIPKAKRTPTVELFGGFSYSTFEAPPVELKGGTVNVYCSPPPSGVVVPCLSLPITTTTVSFSPQIGLYGWNGSITADVTRWFGVTADFSGGYSSASESAANTLTANFVSECSSDCVHTYTFNATVSGVKMHYFLGGPQFAFPAGRTRVFGRFLMGAENEHVTETETQEVNGAIFPMGIVPSPRSGTLFAFAGGGGVDYPIRGRISWRILADYLKGSGTELAQVRVSSGPVWKIGK
jgi:hypothetical protein